MKTVVLFLFAIVLFAFTTMNNTYNAISDSSSCSCKQVKKEGCRQNACTYTFECKKGDGSVTNVKVPASNDNEAKQLAELECD